MYCGLMDEKIMIRISKILAINHNEYAIHFFLPKLTVPFPFVSKSWKAVR